MNSGLFVTERMQVSTNMFTKSFHRVLKYVYMKGRVNKRMDAIINLLIKYARDKAFDRLIKAEKGKSTKHITRIHKRHATSLNLSTSSVRKISENSWQVKSVSSQYVYTLKKECATCEFNCFIKCKFCSICLHNYSCSCDDYIQLGTICKHIHLLARSITGANHSSETSISRINPPAITLCNPSPDKNLKDRILEKLNSVSGFISQCSEIKELSIFENKYLTSMLKFVDLHKSKNINNIPPNKTLTKQVFYSTKRKRTSKVRLGRPTINEKTEISSLLSKTMLKDELSELQYLHNLSTILSVKFLFRYHPSTMHKGRCRLGQ